MSGLTLFRYLRSRRAIDRRLKEILARKDLLETLAKASPLFERLRRDRS